MGAMQKLDKIEHAAYWQQASVSLACQALNTRLNQSFLGNDHSGANTKHYITEQLTAQPECPYHNWPLLWEVPQKCLVLLHACRELVEVAW